MSDARPLVLRGGTVYDGLGSPGVRADVLIADGRVRQIGSAVDPCAVDADAAHAGPVDVPAGARILDCAGLAVAPGFVDPHAHSDLVPFMAEPQPFKLLQGVTTEINGNCGISFAPTSTAAAEQLASSLHEIVRGVEVRPRTMAEFLDAAQTAGPTNHVAYLVGHGTLRLTTNGPAEHLDPPALDKMLRLAAESMGDGALGFSTGLIYPPGCYADTAELCRVARAVAPLGGLYATHMRDEGRRVLDAVDEAVTVARAGGLRLQISHCKLAGRENHGRAGELLARIEAARLAGIDVLGDQYPYTASATALSALLPNVALAGDRAEVTSNLGDPEKRAEWHTQALQGEPGDGLWTEAAPEHVLVVSHADASVVGRTLAELAGERDPFDVVCELVAADPAAGMVIEGMAESDVREIMASPLVAIGSDNGVPGPGPVHPRSVGTYPRLLGRYVRELGVLDLADAIRKATSLVAGHFGLVGRGTLLPGSHADVVVFDPETIGHDGTATDPYMPVTGIQTVVLGGVSVVVGGAFTGERRGLVLRKDGGRDVGTR
ncbi:N-acyl-D-amino-acid deacylase family protein [Phytoactinopolyspora endophytica]|uniref:N-acyl-D-amino-acid deacylase family protein n=1 Tax=Phytoactinopolyspora endophytica TaxID=1642495 RepID=UPI00101BF7B3|nr:amidohydrolase family protein [Phytoactinopolyspora endophytica]